jgi:hypothetical protein
MRQNHDSRCRFVTGVYSEEVTIPDLIVFDDFGATAKIVVLRYFYHLLGHARIKH